MSKNMLLFDIRNWIPYRLWRLSQDAGFLLENYYTDKFQIKGDSWRFLAMLASCAPISAKELGSLLDMDAVQTTRTLNKVLKLGYASRRTDPKDRRRVILNLSKKGADVYQQIVTEGLKLEQQALEGLNPTEQQTFRNLLNQIESNLQSHALLHKPTL